ncbi:MAG: hypothetical protein FWD74_05345 [Actinomycetia bacterium]|nr:hypothetical protein [Actinomycetes bacterium]
MTATEIIDSVWGQLPVEVRRATTRAQVQASLTLLTVRSSIAQAWSQSDLPNELLAQNSSVNLATTVGPPTGAPRHSASVP